MSKSSPRASMIGRGACVHGLASVAAEPSDEVRAVESCLVVAAEPGGSSRRRGSAATTVDGEMYACDRVVTARAAGASLPSSPVRATKSASESSSTSARIADCCLVRAICRLLHPYVGEEFEPDGVGDVLGAEPARGAMLAQGAGAADEFTGRTPQHTCESGEFMPAWGHDVALPGDHMVGRDVRQPVRDPHPVRDVFGAHPESRTEPAGGVRVEGRWGRWGRNRESAHAPQARGAGSR